MNDEINDSASFFHKIAPNATDKAIENLTDEPTKFLGHTGSSILKICFDGINYYAKRLDYKRKLKLERWKEKTFTKLNDIPQENRIDPPLEIAGPITEASKFYFENESLSELFSNLLASACDDRISSVVHPSFTEMLKQMSPHDAKVLDYIKLAQYIPIADYYIRSDDEISKIKYTNVFYLNSDTYGFSTLESNSTSITNLLRLQLIVIPFGKYLADDTLYSIFYNDPIFQILDINTTLDKKEIDKRYAMLTPLGKRFISVCIK